MNIRNRKANKTKQNKNKTKKHCEENVICLKIE